LKIKEENKEKDKEIYEDDDENDISTSFVEENLEKEEEQNQKPTLGMSSLVSQLKGTNKTNTKEEFMNEQAKQFETSEENKITTIKDSVKIPNFMQNRIKNEEFNEKMRFFQLRIENYNEQKKKCFG
jgi:hypothetical protein